MSKQVILTLLNLIITNYLDKNQERIKLCDKSIY